MKKLLILLAVCCLGTAAYAQHLGTEYRLKKVVQVPGRQGVAADKDYFYISDTRGLYKFDHNWNLVQKRVKTDKDGFVSEHVMRIQDGKKHAVEAFHSINFEVFAAGDSYNDLTMIKEADDGSLFCPPERIVKENPTLKVAYDYDTLLKYIFNK